MPKNADRTDWKRLAAMTEEEAEANALADQQNPPLTETRVGSLHRTPRVKMIRQALRLTQDEFAARYRIPLGTLRDWEQGRAEPDQATRAYLSVIAAEPETTAKALASKSAA